MYNINHIMSKINDKEKRIFEVMSKMSKNWQRLMKKLVMKKNIRSKHL